MTRINGPKPPKASPTARPAAARAPAAASEPAAWSALPKKPAAAPHLPAKVDHGLAVADAQALNAAMRGGLTGLGTDEDKLFSILASRDPAHLGEVKRVYLEHFGKSLETPRVTRRSPSSTASARRPMPRASTAPSTSRGSPTRRSTSSPAPSPARWRRSRRPTRRAPAARSRPTWRAT